MHTNTDVLRFLIKAAALTACSLVFSLQPARTQINSGTDVNTSKLANYQNECSIIKNPTNKLQLFCACNNSGPGLYASRSTDGGATWTYPDPADRTIADGDAGQGPAACCDPTLAWDEFGNLFLSYIDASASNIIVLQSIDGGATFTTLATFGPASVDQPTIAAAAGSVWVVWNQSNQMVARGALVTGLGMVGAFNPLQTIPGTNGCSYGDIAIAPSGAVCQVCQTPTGGEGPVSIRVNTDADGLGPGNFGASVVATTSNVGGFDFIPAQNVRSIDAEAGLAYDRFNMSPHFGRLYLVYTDELINESDNTNIIVRFSDDNGGTWSAPVQVNDDPGTRSQFLPRIASNPLSGNIAVTWFDSRNSPGNNTMQVFATMATPTGATPTFFVNQPVSDGTSTGTGGSPPAAGTVDIQYGDYAGMTYFQGVLHPVWPDNSNSTMDNPDAARYDAYTDRVNGGMAANEGDPHITTIDGIYYDFQGAGEFIALQGDGLVVQTRQTPIATSFTIANAYTGLNTCVSLNTAVAARVGKHRVTYQPNINGNPDPNGMQLRIDGVLTTLGASGIDLGDGGRVVKSGVGGGIEIVFPNGTNLIVTPGWWASQSKWYLNVNAYHTTASEGIMGIRSTWLPALPDGSSLGSKPADPHDRYNAVYKKFADAWRVTDATSLFDYAPGTSTATFSISSWPMENPPCELPETKPVKPLPIKEAKLYCAAVTGKTRNQSCVFDVAVTGDPGFAKTYLLTQRLEAGATNTEVFAEPPIKRQLNSVKLTARVARKAAMTGSKELPAGTVQFIVDGEKYGNLVPLSKNGEAQLMLTKLSTGKHRVTAQYFPAKGTVYLSSISSEVNYTVN